MGFRPASSAHQLARATLKTEVIQRRGTWRNLDAAEYATLERVDW